MSAGWTAWTCSPTGAHTARKDIGAVIIVAKDMGAWQWWVALGGAVHTGADSTVANAKFAAVDKARELGIW